jgi:phthalate 4,5-dioxygenase
MVESQRPGTEGGRQHVDGQQVDTRSDGALSVDNYPWRTRHMLSAEDNDRLCRVGPDAPMGQALRRYWVPAFQLGDLPENDCPPIRVRVLGEDFVAFRDTDGRYGFLDEFCCHRNASLVFGRVEDRGIRCIYHGWKYDIDGKILEMPNCDDPRMMERFRQGNYPVVAAGGLGWVYLGPPGTEPDFPYFPWAKAESVAVSEIVYDCNWVQVQEGSLDSSHVAILHLDTLAAMKRGIPRDVGSFHFSGEQWDTTLNFPQTGAGFPSSDNAPRIDVETTPFGFQYAAVRKMDDPTKSFVRVTAFGFPFTAHIGGGGLGGAVIVVPRDDDNCSFIGVRILPPGTKPTSADIKVGATTSEGTVSPNDPVTTNGNGNGNAQAKDPFSAAIPEEPAADFCNDPTETRRWHLPTQDRGAMASRASFAGFIGGNRPQDASVQGVSARDSRFTRATENLLPADAALIRFRRMLFEAARNVEEGRELPARPKGFDFGGVKAASEVIDASMPWQELVPGNSGHSDLSGVS